MKNNLKTTPGVLFAGLEEINARPRPFEFYTAADLWTDDHVSERMLSYHLNGDIDVSSRTFAFIDRSVEWIVSHFGVGSGTAIADFGCGPGLYSSRLARTGANVTGIDFSERSIRYAREFAVQEGLSVDYVHTNYLEFETDTRFDLIVMIMCDFCALSPSQRKTMLEKFRALLKPGGSVLLDVYSLAAYADREESASYALNQLDGFWSPETYYGFQNTFKYDDEKVILDKYTIVEKARIRTVYNWLKYFGREEIEREFAGNGFAVDAFHSNVAGDEYDPDASEFALTAKTIA